MFPRYVIDSITNGVHAATWTSEPFQELFDRYMPDWRQDNYSLRNALASEPSPCAPRTEKPRSACSPK